LPRRTAYHKHSPMAPSVIGFVLVAVEGALATPPVVVRQSDEAALARAAFDGGLAAVEQGDLTGARERFASAYRLAPDWSLAALQFGMAAFAKDPEDSEALDALERAVALDPQNPRAHLQLGIIYEHARRSGDAVREYRAALARRGEWLDARFRLAGALAESGEPEAAIGAYEAVLAADGQHLGALSALAELNEKVGRLDAAELALLTITRMLPAVAYHRYRLANFYQRTGQAAKAERVFVELEELDPRQRKMRKLR
jgi:tetratricopeptide (TPR) repeat protein